MGSDIRFAIPGSSLYLSSLYRDSVVTICFQNNSYNALPWFFVLIDHKRDVMSLNYVIKQ